MQNKKYKVIYADPPWYQRGGGKSKRGADKHYPIMKEAQITRVMKSYLTDRVDDDAHMYMWVANNHLPEAVRIIEELGFRYITNLCWTKPSFGLGRYFRGQHELCLFATKGSGWKVRTHLNNVSSLIGEGFLPKGRHSKKPDAMYELIEDRSMGPYLEMFARNTRPGWDSWGDEIKDEE
jgi:N6-adenosine-specific RNA methylase IME4